MSIDEKALNTAWAEVGGVGDKLCRRIVEAYEAAKTSQQPNDRTDIDVLCKELDAADSIGRAHTVAIKAIRNWEAATKRESSDQRTIMNTALGVILNHRDKIPKHIVQWAESKVDLTDYEEINDIEDGEPK